MTTDNTIEARWQVVENAIGKPAQAWIEIHRDELKADWLLASQGQTVFTIDPLK